MLARSAVLCFCFHFYFFHIFSSSGPVRPDELLSWRGIHLNVYISHKSFLLPQFSTDFGSVYFIYLIAVPSGRTACTEIVLITTNMRAVDRSPDELQLQAQWAIFFVYTHNFRKYCPILIVLSLLQTAIMYPQNVIEFPTLPIVCCCITLKNATAYTSSRKPLNKSAMHAIILLLQSRKFW